MMQTGFASSCPTCGCVPGVPTVSPVRRTAAYRPSPSGFGFAPGWQVGAPGYSAGWGVAAYQPGAWGTTPYGTWMNPSGYIPPNVPAGFGGLGGLRQWGGSYTPQYTWTGLPTDEEIAEMIYDSLDADPFVPPDANIDVKVDAGEVTLTGSVPDKYIKHHIGDRAWAIPGVTDVRNEIEVSGRHRHLTPGAGEARAPVSLPSARRGRARGER